MSRKNVDLFGHYVVELGWPSHFSSVTESCIFAIEQGGLHVDAVNRYGHTVGVSYVLEIRWGHDFQFSLWDKYWALGPDVATFWSALPADKLVRASKERDILISTPILWEDLELVQSFAYKHPWIEEEVTRRRIKASLRFAWIAAVVAEK